MGWFDVAEARTKKSFAVAAYRAGSGSRRLQRVPSATPAGTSLGDWLINRLFFRGAWTVRVAPWYGKRGRKWKERLATEPEADQRAAALFSLIHRGEWDPDSGPPPS